MTLGQIKCFVTVATEQSFAKAASALYISQPALSKSISKLEEELGFLLLDRKSGKLRLTPSGRKLFDLFVRTESDYQDIIGEIRQFLSESAETIRLGCPDTWNPKMFYDKIMEHFHEIFPAINLEIECYRVPELLDRLHAGKLNLIMTYELYRPVQYGFSVRHLTDIGCGILYSKNYFKNIRSLDDLSDADFLVFDVDVEKKFGMDVKRFCSDYGFEPKIKNCDRFCSAVFNMSCGKGVMLFTEWDNIITSTPYDCLSVPYRVPIKLVFQSVSDKPGIPLFVDELVELFSNN